MLLRLQCYFRGHRWWYEGSVDRDLSRTCVRCDKHECCQPRFRVR